MRLDRSGLAAAVVALAWIPAGHATACRNVEISRVSSPTGKLAAVMFNRDCGATTGFSTQVSIVAAEADVSGIGNIFRADTDRGAARAGSWGGPWATMEWLSPKRLLIRYAANARIFARRAAMEGVEIAYEPGK